MPQALHPDMPAAPLPHRLPRHAAPRLHEEMAGRAALYREHGELASRSKELAQQAGKLQQLLQETNAKLEEHTGGVGWEGKGQQAVCWRLCSCTQSLNITMHYTNGLHLPSIQAHGRGLH
jgi:hypothetical protein